MFSCTRREQLTLLAGLAATAAFPARSLAPAKTLEWKIGNARIRRVWERDVAPLDPTRFFPDATPAAMASIPWLHPWFTDEHGQITLSISAFLIDSLGKRILVDTGIGSFDIPGFPLLPRRGAAVPGLVGELGAPLDSIDHVVNTHLHADHVGGNVRSTDSRPTFPNAFYVAGRKDYDYWSTQVSGSFGRRVFEAAVRPIASAGRLELIDEVTALTNEVSLVPSPGHTPGHFSVLISSSGEEALISGDMLHHPVQLAFPDRGMDQDESAGAATRRKLLAELAERKALLIGSHFPAPTAGRVQQAGNAFRLVV